MTYRRGQQNSFPDLSEIHAPNPMDQLTLRCMMCKMDSSTDSDSEISPRWSDTSTLGCVSSAPESGTSRRTVSLTYKSVGRHACCSLFLDPYDGSSEDSDESNGGTSRQARHHGKGDGGGFSLSGQKRRLFFHHSASLTVSGKVTNSMRDSLIHQSVIHKDTNEARMKYGSDSELWDCGLGSEVKRCKRPPEEGVSYSTKDIHAMEVEVQLGDSGLDGTRSSTCCTPGLHTLEDRNLSQMLSSCSERSLRPLCKRKGFPPGAESEEAEPRKRQCVKNMEDEREETG